MLRTTLLTCDTPDKNGNIYPKEVLEKAIKNIHNNELFVVSSQESDIISISNITGYVKNISLENNNVTGDLTFLPQHIVNEELIKSEKFRLSPIGLGLINDKKEVSNDYQLLSLTIIPA